MPSLGRVLERLTVAVDADTSQAERKLNDLSDESKGGSWIGKMGGGAAKAAGLMGAAAGAGVLAMGGLGLAAASQAEQSEIAFTSIMGDASKAKSFLADLSKFAAETPFELPGLKDAASRLLATGTEANKVIPIMRAVGDSTSAMGTGAEGIDRAVTALTQMQVKGKITGEEMLQLAEAGVPAWDALATVMGVSVAEAQKKVSAGQGNVNDLFKALETQAGPAMGRVKGMMDKQSESAAGMLSTLKDTATQGLGNMMMPVLVEVKKVMPQVSKLMSGTFEKAGPLMGKGVSAAIDFIKKMAPVVGPVLKEVGGELSKAFKTLGPALAKLGPPLMDLFKALLPALPAVAKAFGTVATVIATVAKVAAPLIRLFAKLIAAIPPVVWEVLAKAMFGIVGVGIMLYKNFDRLPELFSSIAGAVGRFFQRLPGLAGDAVGWLAEKFREFAPKVLEAIGDFAVVVGDWLWGTALPWLGEKLWEGIKWLADKWLDLAQWTLDALVEYAPKVVAWFTDTALPWLIGKFAEGIVALGKLWLDLAQWTLDALIEYVPKLVEWWYGTALPWLGEKFVDGIKGLARLWLDLGQWTLDALVEFGPKLVGWWFDTALPTIIRAVTDGLGTVANLFMDLPGMVVDAIGSLHQAGVDLVVGLWNGVNSMGDWLAARVRNFAKNSVKNVLDDVFLFGSPSKVMIQRGKWIGEGLGAGIIASTARVSAASGALAAAAMPGASGVARPSFASSSTAASAASTAAAAPNVFQLPDGSVMSMSELKKRMRVLFIEDGGANAFATAIG